MSLSEICSPDLTQKSVKKAKNWRTMLSVSLELTDKEKASVVFSFDEVSWGNFSRNLLKE